MGETEKQAVDQLLQEEAEEEARVSANLNYYSDRRLLVILEQHTLLSDVFKVVLFSSDVCLLALSRSSRQYEASQDAIGKRP